MVIPTSNYDFKAGAEDTKVHNTAKTSILSYIEVKNSGQNLREKKIVFEAIQKNQPVTSRALSKITGIERTNVTRTVFDLLHEINPQIKIFKVEKCPTTNRKVQWYSTLNYSGGFNHE